MPNTGTTFCFSIQGLGLVLTYCVEKENLPMKRALLLVLLCALLSSVATAQPQSFRIICKGGANIKVRFHLEMCTTHFRSWGSFSSTRRVPPARPARGWRMARARG